MNYHLNKWFLFLPLPTLKNREVIFNNNKCKRNYANNFTISTKRKSQNNQEE